MTVTATALTACASTGETRPVPTAQAGPTIPAARLDGGLFAVRPDSAATLDVSIAGLDIGRDGVAFVVEAHL